MSEVSNAAAPSTTAQSGTKRPNLVFFFGEGQRNDTMSIAGHPFIKTPNHDRIAREGAMFTNAFCTNALCAPARAVVLTGMYSRSTGALDNAELTKPLPEDIPLFTQLLQAAGYEVAIVGKVHVNNGAEERNWDYYFGHNAASNNYYSPMYKEGRKGKIGPEQTFHKVWADDLATDRALAWLDEDRGDKPFCLLLWFVAPHGPFYRARRHLDRYNGVPVAKPATFDDDKKGYPGKPPAFAEATNKIGTRVDVGDPTRSLEELVKDFCAGIEGVDDNMGRVMDALEKKGVLDDTAVVMGSDHGFFLGEWRCYNKRLMHEPSIRVPLMMRYPKRIPAGTVRKEMALDLDIAPTLLDIAGVATPQHMQGKSLLPVVQKADPEFRKEWYYEYYEWPNEWGCRPNRGIRTDKYKYMQYVMDPPQFEMYDLEKDPGELDNLYGKPEHAALQKDLAERLEKLRNAVPERHI